MGNTKIHASPKRVIAPTVLDLVGVAKPAEMDLGPLTVN